MPNKILNEIITARNGHYCHAIECASIYDYQATIEAIADEFRGYNKQDVINFFNSIELYYLNDEDITDDENSTLEDELYAFNAESFINDLS